MKNIRQKVSRHTLLLLLPLGLILSTGCSDSNDNSSSGVVTTSDGVETPSSPHWEESEGGANVRLSLYSINRFNDYTHSNFDDPQDVQMNLNLEKVSDTSKTYTGTLNIGFYEYTLDYDGEVSSDNEFFEDSFSSGGFDDWDNASVSKSSKYNYWYRDSETGKKIFKAFFQDHEGPILLIIDKVNKSVGDGQAARVAGGSLWFKRFNSPAAEQPPTVCWLISLGPYDCRPKSWRTNRGIHVERSIYPSSNSNDYRKLGSFQGLDLRKALNLDESGEEDDEFDFGDYD